MTDDELKTADNTKVTEQFLLRLQQMQKVYSSTYMYTQPIEEKVDGQSLLDLTMLDLFALIIKVSTRTSNTRDAYRDAREMLAIRKEFLK